MKIVEGKQYLSESKDLIKEYLESLGRDLSFQNVDAYYHNSMEDVIYMKKQL